MSQMVFHGVHLLDDTLIDHTACCANAVTPHRNKEFRQTEENFVNITVLCCPIRVLDNSVSILTRLQDKRPRNRC